VSLHVFCFFDSEYVVAADIDDAKVVYCEHSDSGCSSDELDVELSKIRQLGDYESTAIWCYPDGSICPIDEDGCEPVEKTCVEWAAQNGRGFLASTEY
jgi:hypothetical protein